MMVFLQTSNLQHFTLNCSYRFVAAFAPVIVVMLGTLYCIAAPRIDCSS